MAAILRVVNGQRAGQRVTVGAGETLSIGRSGESDLQLLGLGVSRFHCVVEEHADDVVVADLNSSNGTFVNGQRVKRQPLRVGDEIEIGTIKLVVEAVPQRRAEPVSCYFTESSGSETRVVPVVKLPDATEAAFPGAAGQGDQELRRHLGALEKVYKAIAAEERPARLMAMVMDTVLEVVRAERGFLLLSERGGGLRAQVARTAPWASVDPRLPVSRSVLRASIERGASVLCPDLQAGANGANGAQAPTGHTRSVLCAPLQSGDRVLGALYLDVAASTWQFTKQDAEIVGAIARHTGLALHKAELVDDLERLFVGAIETLVAAVEAKDIYTYGHSARVSKLARRIAEGMGLAEPEQEQVKLAGLLHDIGKIGIPEAVLSQRGHLTDDEWAYVRSHPQIGESIIRQMGSDRVAMLCQLVRHHHERLDGTGYPDGLTGDAIPLGARILSVADAYDAMRSNRPYRSPYSAKEAIAELRLNSGRQFDAEAIEALAELRSEARQAAGAEEA
ncbi:MAG TPA: HD domain-containing protein [Planctomycetota bacterium]|nr:HD domain-containing protein [Planctomycetota bacterium]HRR81270.1 HD domain-containing protein [Planctomycetota bacterium]HRT95291.1 HD domain-containing protein [Planctomycetota bacterium]